MAKKIIIFILMIFSLFASFNNEVMAESPVNIKINGEIVKFNDDLGYPFVDKSNRTQVPLRAVLEKIGAEISWEQSAMTAIAEKNGVKVEVPIGRKYILVNGEKLVNDTAALIKDGRTYLPIRIVMEAFGYEVDWDSNTSSVLISSVQNRLNKDCSTSLPIIPIGEYKGWIYYYDEQFSIFKKFPFQKLMRIKTDGSEKEILIDDSEDDEIYFDDRLVDIINDKIYIISADEGLYRTDLDFKNKEIIDEEAYQNAPIDIIQIIDDRIYYNVRVKTPYYDYEHIVKTDDKVLLLKENGELDYEKLEEGKEYKKYNEYFISSKLDGSDRVILYNDRVYDYYIMGDWIFFLEDISGVTSLYRVKKDGTSLEKIQDDVYVGYSTNKFLFDNEYFYYIDSESEDIYKTNLLTKETQLVTDTSDKHSYLEMVHEGYLYFTKYILKDKNETTKAGWQELYRIRTDRTGLGLIDKGDCWSITKLKDGNIYFGKRVDFKSPSHISKMNVKTTERIDFPKTTGYTSFLRIIGDWIYAKKYKGDRIDGIYKIHIDDLPKGSFIKVTSYRWEY